MVQPPFFPIFPGGAPASTSYGSLGLGGGLRLLERGNLQYVLRPVRGSLNWDKLLYSTTNTLQRIVDMLRTATFAMVIGAYTCVNENLDLRRVS